MPLLTAPGSPEDNPHALTAGRAPAPPSAKEPELMTPAETQKALRVSAATLARWARNGDIPFVKLPGGHRRYRRTVIDGILAGSTGATSDVATTAA